MNKLLPTLVFIVFFIVLLVLKLTGYIDLSWWWVTAPLWIDAAFGSLIAYIVILFCERKK